MKKLKQIQSNRNPNKKPNALRLEKKLVLFHMT